MRPKLHSDKLKFSVFRDFRDFESLTLSEMARRMKIKPQCLDSLEKTQGKVSIKHLIAFWRAVDCDATVLLEELEKDLNAPETSLPE